MISKQTKFSKKGLGGIVLAVAIIEISSFALMPPHNAIAEEGFAYPGQTAEGKAETAAGKKTEEISPTSGAPCESNISVSGVFTGKADFTCAALIAVNTIVDAVFYIPFSLVEYFFSWAIESNFNIVSENHPIRFAVQIGYPIVLGAANMFFVLILLWIAVATIFNFEPYTARSLLMPLIITALLINFSQPIANALIGFSNGLSNMFYQQLLRANSAHTIQGAVQDMFWPTELIALATQPAKDVAKNCEGLDAEACGAKIFETTRGQYRANGATHDITAKECLVFDVPPSAADSTKQATCAALTASASAQANLIPNDPRNIHSILATSIAWKIVVYPIVIFVLFAATILLVNRIVVLAFVLILGPAAFLMNILPNTKFLNKMWWDNLAKYSFFLPVFMFFFWLGLLMALKIPGGFYQRSVTQQSIDIYSAMTAYLISAAFMIGALIAASKFGTMGAATVTGWGQKMSKSASGWAKDRGWKYGGMATSAAARIPGVRGIIGRVPPLRAGAAAVIKRGAAIEKKDTAFYTKLSDRELANSLRGMGRGQRQEIWNALDQKRRAKIHEEAEKQGFDMGVSVGKPTWRQSAASAMGHPVPGPMGIIRPSLNDMRQSVRKNVKPIFDEMLNSGEMRGIGEDLPVVQGAVRNALEEAISKMPARATPEEFNFAVREFTDRAVKKAFPNKPQHAASVQQSIRSRADKIGLAAGSAMRTKVEKPKPPTMENLVEKIGELEAETDEIKSKQQKT